MNGETNDVFTIPPTVETSATLASSVGNYPITVVGGVASNYLISRFSGTLTVLPDIPEVTVQPADQLVQDGTNTNFTIASVTSADASTYDVVISNSFSSVTSETAILGLIGPPVLLSEPNDQAVAVGGTLVLEVQHGGTAPLSIYWYKDGQLIGGATGNALTRSNVVRADSEIYRAEVSNIVGIAISQNALVRVLVPQRLLMPIRLPDGRFRLQLTGSDGVAPMPDELSKLVIQASPDFAAWQTISTNGAGLTMTNGTARFDDTGATGQPSRFYRVFER
ncbi:MAG: hypothetical protein CMO80_08970 [Verrucomicrobiales bacterium]|nr:hypothetical protein [Verrucomicrobiales bacterium]